MNPHNICGDFFYLKTFLLIIQDYLLIWMKKQEKKLFLNIRRVKAV